MNENDENTLDLDLNDLETRALGLVWGLMSSVSKDGGGNPLLKQLASVFGEEYALRTGKLSLIGDTEHEFNFDFEKYSVDHLERAFFHLPHCLLHLKKMINGHRQSFAAQFWCLSRMP